MRALLVMVHGSPRPGANSQVLEILDLVRARGAYDLVQIGFLECNAPSIPEAIELCVRAGAHSVTAVPYFLHTGTHVAIDLPALLEAARLLHPAVTFLLGRYVGQSAALTDILHDRARAVA